MGTRKGDKMRLILFTLISLFLLSACVPNAKTYYFPSSDGGEVRSGRCVATESLLDFEIKSTHKSIKIRARAAEGKNFNSVYLFFSGNSWNKINFTSTNFKIVDLANNLTISNLSSIAFKHDGTSKLNTESYTAPHSRGRASRFFVEIRLPEPMPEKFELFIPTIMIDGDKIKIPTIRFERKVWVGISPFNC